MLLPILLASLLESVISFTGGFLVIFRESFAKIFAHRVLGFAVGALIGVSLFDLLPEASAVIGERAFHYAAGGIVLFFVLERFLFWYHRHDGRSDIRTFNYLILIGDAVHNFIDGVIISLSFLVSMPLGVATTMAVMLHEIPQEIADFGVLIAGGYSRIKALWFNFLISLTTILGALSAYFLGSRVESVLPYASAIIAGNFLYIALTDLMPEVQEQAGAWHAVSQFTLFAGGIALMYFVFS